MITTASGQQLRHVLLIDGGWSDESIRGYSFGPDVLPVLEQIVPHVTVLQLHHPDFFSAISLLAETIDVVLLTTLGSYGEDGKLQGFLEILGLPYVGTGVVGSAIFLNKWISKQMLRSLGMSVANDLIVRPGETPPSFGRVGDTLGVPFVLKPSSTGASIGITLVEDEEVYTRETHRSVSYYGDTLLETCLYGNEYTVGVIEDDRETLVLPVCQTVSDGIYETANKLSPQYAFPLRDEAPLETMRDIARIIHRTFCSGMSRVDMMVSDGRVSVLEVNTLPGLLPFSAFPAACVQAGISQEQMLTMLLKSAFRQRPMEVSKRFKEEVKHVMGRL